MSCQRDATVFLHVQKGLQFSRAESIVTESGISDSGLNLIICRQKRGRRLMVNYRSPKAVFQVRVLASPQNNRNLSGVTIYFGDAVPRTWPLNCDDPEIVEGEEAMPSGNSSSPGAHFSN